MNITEIIENEDLPFLFDCPDCGHETEATIYVDRRDYGSGTTWARCIECYGPFRGEWEAEDVRDRLRLA